MTACAGGLRLAVVYRADLDMPRAKSEVQFGHAIAMLIAGRYPGLTESYMRGSQLKISLEVADEAELQRIIDKAEARHVQAVKVVDAGKTVFGAPTFTCVGLGPMNKTDCNAITRGAKMRS